MTYSHVPHPSLRRLRAPLLLALFLLLPWRAEAAPVNHPDRWALGLMLGGPTGISAKHWLGGSDAIDIGLGTGPGLRLHADYLFGLAQLLSNTRDAKMDLYLGVGGVVGVARGWCGYYDRRRYCDGDAFVGARVPIGLDITLRRVPLEFGLEFAPGIWFPGPAHGLFDAFLFARVLL